MRSKSKWIAIIVILISTMLVAMACGGDATSTPAPATSTPTPPPAAATPTPKPFEGQTLVWTAYSGQFYDAIKETAIPSFEEKTGATVQLVPGVGADLGEILAAPADNPPYDGIFGDGTTLLRGIEEGVWLQLRRENIPNMDDLHSFHLSDHGEGRDVNFAAPFQYGFSTLVFNKEILGFTPTSWSDLWRPEAQGKISMSTAYWILPISAAAFALDLEPGPNELYTPEGFDAIIEKLQELDVALWWSSGAEATAALERGDTAIDPMTPEFQPIVARDPERFGMFTPEEGTAGFIDYMLIPRGTSKQDLAEAFINHLLDPEVQAAYAEIQPFFVSNSKTVYGPAASRVLPSPEEMAERAILWQWSYLLPHWEEYEERLKREVFTQ